MAENTGNGAEDAGSFEERHKKELGVGSFAKEGAFHALIPLASAAAAGVAGYYVLGRPIKTLLPRAVKVVDTLKTMGGALHDIWNTGDLPEKIKDVEKLLGEECKPSIDKITEIIAEKKAKSPPHEIIKIFDEMLDGIPLDKVNEVRAVFGLPPQDFLGSARWIGAGVGGFTGLLGGGIVVGYDHWRKQESERLAAQEINEDVAKLELFKPSDPELVAENKRLRQMLAEAEKSPQPAASLPTEAANDPEFTVSDTRHDGALEAAQHANRRG